MKNLTHYLIECEQTYEFKIKIAQLDMDNDMMDRVEHALKAFDLDSISQPKHLPIKEKCLDFPSLGTCEVSLITASLKCPCTDEQIRVAISKQGRIPLANIVVIPKNQPEELRREEEAKAGDDTTKKEAILTKELENVSGGQELVGDKKVESLLKELETRRIEFANKAKTKKPETTNCLPQNTKSPVSKKAHSVKVK